MPEYGIEPADAHSVNTLCPHFKILTDRPTDQHAHLLSCSVTAKKKWMKNTCRERERGEKIN